MKFTKEQKSNSETVPAVDVELSDEQLEVVAGGVYIIPISNGGIIGGEDGGGCTGGGRPTKIN